MSSKAVGETTPANGELSPHDSEGLCAGTGQQEDLFDARIKADFQAGRLEDLIGEVVDQERLGLTTPL